MIKGLILTSNTGICLYYKSYGCEFDTELLNNFLVANNLFSTKMIGESIDKIQMREKTQFIFDRDDSNNLIFILIADIADNPIFLRLKLEHIKHTFLLHFPEISQSIVNNNSKYYKIPNKELVDKIIDPIIFPHHSNASINDLIKYIGIKNMATLFSSLLSKQKIIVYGDNIELIRSFISIFPVLTPFREYFVTKDLIKVENIAVVVPSIENFKISSAPDCWWIVGCKNCEIQDSDKSIIVVDINQKNLINGIPYSFYEYQIINSVKNVKDCQIANMSIMNKMQDLLNSIEKLINHSIINEELLKAFNMPAYLLPIIKKIVKNDFSMELDIQEHYFTTKTKEIFG